MPMGGPQHNLLQTCQDTLDDRLDLQPQMGAGPPEHSSGPLQNGDFVREEVEPRRRGCIALIESCQGPSGSTNRCGGVALPKKDLLECAPGSFIEDECSKLT